jgi:UDP-glucose 4-epimerase
MANRVLLTGATGFVGRAVLDRLTELDFDAVAASRDFDAVSPDVRRFGIDRLDAGTEWEDALRDVACVIHTAARVPGTNDAEHAADFRTVNVDGTLNLARQAADAGVRRFVFLSSIKVNGEETTSDRPFDADDAPAPVGPYGISKLQAEQQLLEFADSSGMDVVIIRPPLVYGPHVKASFLGMMRSLDKGSALPFGLIRNKRSLIGVDNLVGLIVTCISHPGAANQVFLISDGEDLSTPELLRRLGRAMGKPARLVPTPLSAIESGDSFLGKPEVVRRLCRNLHVDISKTKRVLGWAPTMSVDDGLRRTATWYRVST